MAVPCGSAQAPHTPLSIESPVAVPPVTCQVNVTGCPGVIVLGVAVKLSKNGTVTVRFWVAVPPGPAAVMVKVVVVFRGTTEDPVVDKAPVSSFCATGGVMVTDVAFVVAHEIVVV